MRKEARDLVRRGFSYKEVGRMMGVSAGGVRYVCDPEFAKKTRENTKNCRRKKVAATKALQEQNRLTELRHKAKESGGAIEEVYSLVRRALQKTDEAQMQRSSPEYRSALRETMRMLHRAEDAIAVALRAPS
jgi:predicted transcriptional regulator